MLAGVNDFRQGGICCEFLPFRRTDRDVIDILLCQALGKWRQLEERYLEEPSNTPLWVEEAALQLR